MEEFAPFSLDLSIYARSFSQINKGESPVSEFRAFLEELGHDVANISDQQLADALSETQSSVDTEQPLEVEPPVEEAMDPNQYMVESLNRNRKPDSTTEAYFDEGLGRVRLRDTVTGETFAGENSLSRDEDEGMIGKAGNPNQTRGNPETGHPGQFGPGGVSPKGEEDGGKGASTDKPAGKATGGTGQEKGASESKEATTQAASTQVDPFEAQDMGNGLLMSANAQQKIGPMLEQFFPGKNVHPHDLIKMVGAPEGMQVEVGVLGGPNPAIVITGVPNEKIEAFGGSLTQGLDGNAVVRNEMLFIRKEFRDAGLGREIFSKQVSDLVSRGGVSKIAATAERVNSLDPDKEAVGYCVWPLFGYDGDIPGAFKERMPPELAGANKISELYDTPGGREWWTENGDSISLTFDLTPHSDSMNRLNGYLAKKGMAPIQQPRINVEAPQVNTRKGREDRLSRFTQNLRRSEGSSWELHRAAWEIMAQDVLLPVYGAEVTKSICEWAEEKSLVDTADPHTAFLDAYRQSIQNEIGGIAAQEKLIEMGQEVALLTKRYEEDPSDGPTYIGRRDDEAADFKVARQGYSVYAPGKYTPCGRTVRMLAPGVYQCFLDVDGNARFVRKEIEVDALIRFPDSIPDQVLQEIDDFWGKEAIFKRYGFLFRRGFILYGKQGCGKSSAINQIMEGVVQRGDVALLCRAPDAIIQCLLQLREIEPERRVLCVFEDIDSIIRKYGDEELLNWLDGQMCVDRCVVCATTNYPDRLDPRIISRPRRFDRVIEIPPPTPRMRDEYFKRKVADLSEEERREWVAATDGLPFASLAEVVISIMCLGMDIKTTVSRLRLLDGPPPSSESYTKRLPMGYNGSR